nr:hypothetical protein [Tanacetum cinerariifolium]
QILLGTLTGDEHQPSIRRLDACADEVSLHVVSIALVVQSARHWSWDDAARYSPDVAEGE